MASAEPPVMLCVLVAYSPVAGAVDEVPLTLPEGTTLRSAIEASGLLQRHPQIDLSVQAVGVWGKRRELGDVLRNRDRVEIYRPLSVDPKEARRLRYGQHRAKFRGA